MIDRKELLQVRISPFDSWTESLYFSYDMISKYTIRHLLRVMLWRYYEKLSQKYDWGIEMETCSAALTATTIWEDEQEEELCYLPEANAQLMQSVADRFGWKTSVVLVEYEDEAYLRYQDGRDSLKTFLNTYVRMDEDEKQLFLSFESIFQSMFFLEDNIEIRVLKHSKLGNYLKFRTKNMSQVNTFFQEEDQKIMELLEYLGHPLFIQFNRNWKQEGDEFLAAFICGYTDEMDIDLSYLTPEWVIGSFVVYELLLHAEQIFGYQEKQKKEC